MFRNHFQLNSGTSPVRSRLRSFSSRRVNSPVYDLDWPAPVETENRSRCGRSLVRCGAHLGLGCPCQAFWWSGHAPVTNVACNCVPSVRTGRVGIHPQPNAGLVENVQLVLPGVRLVVGVRRVGGGDPLSSEYQPSGLAIAMVETLRHEVGRGGGRGVGGKRGIVDGAQLKRWSNCRGVVSRRARWGDSVRRSWTTAAGRQISLRQERPWHTDGKAVG